MGLLDLFTGSASNKAAKQNAGAIAQGQANSTNALQTTAGGAMNLLGFGPGGGGALGALGQGFDRARTDLGASNDRVQDLLGQAGALYGNLTQTGLEASNARSDALGLNGADGLSRAKAAFQGSLGYNAGLDSGLDAVMRTAAARGNLAGGNTSRDLFDYGRGGTVRECGAAERPAQCRCVAKNAD